MHAYELLIMIFISNSIYLHGTDPGAALICWLLWRVFTVCTLVHVYYLQAGQMQRKRLVEVE